MSFLAALLRGVSTPIREFSLCGGWIWVSIHFLQAHYTVVHVVDLGDTVLADLIKGRNCFFVSLNTKRHHLDYLNGAWTLEFDFSVPSSID